MNVDEIAMELRSRVLKQGAFDGADVFLFGSAARDSSHVHDVDIGVIGGSAEALSLFRDELEEGSFPYKVDVVDFTNVDTKFREKVFHDGVIWLTEKKK